MVSFKILVVAAAALVATTAAAGLGVSLGAVDVNVGGGGDKSGDATPSPSEKTPPPLAVLDVLCPFITDQSSESNKICRYVAELESPTTPEEGFIPFVLLCKVAGNAMSNLFPKSGDAYTNFGLAIAKVLLCVYKIGATDSAPKICESTWGSNWQFPQYQGTYEENDVSQILEFYGFRGSSRADFIDNLKKSSEDGLGIFSLKGSAKLLANEIYSAYNQLDRKTSWDQSDYGTTIFQVTLPVSIVGAGFNVTLGLDVANALFDYYPKVFTKQNKIQDLTEHYKDLVRNEVNNCTSETFNDFWNTRPQGQTYYEIYGKPFVDQYGHGFGYGYGYGNGYGKK